MNRRIIQCSGILLFALAVAPARAEVIDKTVAAVDGRIITQSDIRKEHTIQAVLGSAAESAESDEALLQSMIRNDLLDEQMADYPGLEVSDDEIDERLKTIPDTRGMAAAELRAALKREIQRYKYLSLRYRQFIVVSNEEIQTYYNTRFVPEAQKRGAAVPELKDVSEMIRANLFEEKVLDELNMSLETIRARSNIEIFQ